jgi:transposase
MLMAEKQWKRRDILKRLAAGEMTVSEAAQALRLSSRQMRRIAAKFALKGVKALVHGNFGRAPPNKTTDATRARVLVLMAGKYAGFNDTHFTEKLAKYEGLKLARATVRRFARAAGLAAARPRRSRQYRSRREREAQAGMLLLWDGSRHDWLEGRGPLLCLMGAIDDATGELMPGAHFLEQESAAGYLRVLAALVAEKGIPQKLYMDRHGSLKRNDDYWTLDEQLEGKQEPTQVGKALEALGIEAIFALSPQAKGRVERLWGTLQDRLVSELRLAKVATVAEANAFLEKYRAEFNQGFAKPARDSRPAWRPVQRGFDVPEACSFRYEATVGNDNVVSLAGLKLQVPRPTTGRSYAKAHVQVHQLLNGTWRIKYQGQLIAELQLAGAGAELRARKRHRHSKVLTAFMEGVRKFEAPPSPRARQPAGSRVGRPKRPYNLWTKKEKQRAAKASAQRRAQRPASW